LKLGHRLRFISLRRPGPDDLKVELLPEEKVLCLEDVYKKGIVRVSSHLRLLLRKPGPYLRTLAWVLKHRGAWRLFKAVPYLYDYAKGADWIHGTFAWDQAGYAMVLSRLTKTQWSFTARAADIYAVELYSSGRGHLRKPPPAWPENAGSVFYCRNNEIQPKTFDRNFTGSRRQYPCYS